MGDARMIPTEFPESNKSFSAPQGTDESQVQAIRACVRERQGGTLDGSMMIIVAWRPSQEEIEQIRHGNPIYLTCLDGLPPHYLATTFEEALLPHH
jgi:hypothetical protein